MSSKENTEQVAQIILHQLGGKAFIVMTGAHTFLCGDENGQPYLSFKLPNNAKNRINYVKIILNPMDWYSVQFGHIANRKGEMSYRVIREHEMIYEDRLREIFTEETGLDIDIPKIIWS